MESKNMADFLKIRPIFVTLGYSTLGVGFSCEIKGLRIRSQPSAYRC